MLFIPCIYVLLCITLILLLNHITMKRTFTPGEEVRIKSDRFNRYRYVSRNIVRNIKTGRIKSVQFEQIRPASIDIKFGIQLIITALLLMAIIKFAS